jgi:hypothetical protein
MTPPAFDPPVRGAAYSPAMRIFASLAMLVIVVYGVRAWDVVAAGGWTSPAALVFLAAFLGMAGSYVVMLRSVTVIDATGIRQTGLMEKKIAWADVRMARVARWGATRLIVKGERGPFTVFFGGTAALREAFVRIAAAAR